MKRICFLDNCPLDVFFYAETKNETQILFPEIPMKEAKYIFLWVKRLKEKPKIRGSEMLSLNPSWASTSLHGTAGDFKLRISKTRVKISFIFPKKITAAQVHDNGIQNIEIWIKDKLWRRNLLI